MSDGFALFLLIFGAAIALTPLWLIILMAILLGRGDK